MKQILLILKYRRNAFFNKWLGAYLGCGQVDNLTDNWKFIYIFFYWRHICKNFLNITWGVFYIIFNNLVIFKIFVKYSQWSNVLLIFRYFSFKFTYCSYFVIMLCMYVFKKTQKNKAKLKGFQLPRYLPIGGEWETRTIFWSWP